MLYQFSSLSLEHTKPVLHELLLLMTTMILSFFIQRCMSVLSILHVSARVWCVLYQMVVMMFRCQNGLGVFYVKKAVVCFMLKKKEGCVLCQNVCRMFYAWTRCMLILYSGCLAKVRPKRREKSGLEREMAYGNGFISLNDKGYKSKREMA